MIRDFHSDPLPQGCPFSFIAMLKKNTSTKASTEALLGALRYKECDTLDLSVRQIRDWFAFDLDDKTTGLWGYFNNLYNFKITAGGKQDKDGVVTGKDQALVEVWDSVYGFGLNLYSKTESDKPMTGLYLYSSGFIDAYTSVVKENDSGFWGFSRSDYQYKLTAGQTQTLWQLWSQSTGFYYATYVKSDRAGFYQVSSGDADFFGGFTKSGEASIWGYTIGNWQFKLEAGGSASTMSFWHGGYDDPEDGTAAFAKVYAYYTSAGFTCCKTDDVHSTLEPSSLFCVDKTTKKKGTYYAGGAFIEHDAGATYTYIEGYTVWVVDKNAGADGKLFPGWMGVKKFDKSFCQIDGSYILVGGNGSADAKIYPGEIWAKTSNGSQFSAVGGTMRLSYPSGGTGTYEPGAITLKGGGGTVYIDASAIGSKTAYFQAITVCVGGVSKQAFFLMTDPQ